MARYFITGGTGSLGKALTKRLIESGHEVIIYSRDEGKQALLFRNEPQVTKIIGDVRDYDKLNVSLQRHYPNYIIHAAALKRIDDMELYPDECIKTNINGSENVARAALENGVEKTILVSTDKACKPVNVYGSSKFIAERVFANYDYSNSELRTRFASVRYGNVIASRGSFIPLFMEWIEKGVKIKVTSEEMTRFLFTLSDAVDTVLNAVEIMEGGEVFVPKLRSYTLPDCVRALEMITGKTAEFNVVGLRPGEKLHEDMLAETELDFTWEHKNTNLLQIRPQLSWRKYPHRHFKKYDGPHFNSALWVSRDVDDLVTLIQRGLED